MSAHRDGVHSHPAPNLDAYGHPAFFQWDWTRYYYRDFKGGREQRYRKT